MTRGATTILKTPQLKSVQNFTRALDTRTFRTNLDSHRSGWAYAMNALNPIYDADGILVIDFIENYFSWGYSQHMDKKTISLVEYGEVIKIDVELEFVRVASLAEVAEGLDCKDECANIKTHVAWFNREVAGLHSESKSRSVEPAAYWDKAKNSWEWIVHPRDVLYTQFPQAYKKPAAITTPWIGFWHNPPNMPTGVEHSPQDIAAGEAFRASLKQCFGIIVFSNYMKQWVIATLGDLAKNVSNPIPVDVLYHPTEPAKMFSLQKFFADFTNDAPQCVQIGYWLRDMQAIWNLRTDNSINMGSAAGPKWRRLWLYGSAYALDVFAEKLPNIYRDKFVSCSAAGKASRFDFAMNGAVVEVARVSNDEYDDILTSSVCFLNLLDSSCNNAIIECVARGTPIIVNRHPAAVEYLGEDYPLFYDELVRDDLDVYGNEMLKMRDTLRLGINIRDPVYASDLFNCASVQSAHEYLMAGRAPCAKYLSADAYLNAFLKTETWKLINERGYMRTVKKSIKSHEENKYKHMKPFARLFKGHHDSDATDANKEQYSRDNHTSTITTQNFKLQDVNTIYKKPDVDLVITWVDSSNKKWAAVHDETVRLYEEAAKSQGKEWQSDSDTPNRYRNNFDELKYCIRAARTSMPWLSKIYIVVADFQEVPEWLECLDTTSIIVRHSALGLGVCFNSLAIEANLYKIPGLAEHFIYLNDDMFVFGKWQFEDCFTSEYIPIGYCEKYMHNNSTYSFDIAWKNTADVLNAICGNGAKWKVMPHGPYVLTKTMFAHGLNNTAIRAAMLQTSKSAFRGKDDVLPTCGLLHYYCEAEGLCVMRDRSHHVYTEDVNDSRICNGVDVGVLCIQDNGNIDGAKIKHILDGIWPATMDEIRDVVSDKNANKGKNHSVAKGICTLN